MVLDSAFPGRITDFPACHGAMVARAAFVRCGGCYAASCAARYIALYRRSTALPSLSAGGGIIGQPNFIGCSNNGARLGGGWDSGGVLRHPRTLLIFCVSGTIRAIRRSYGVPGQENDLTGTHGDRGSRAGIESWPGQDAPATNLEDIWMHSPDNDRRGG